MSTPAEFGPKKQLLVWVWEGEKKRKKSGEKTL